MLTFIFVQTCFAHGFSPLEPPNILLCLTMIMSNTAGVLKVKETAYNSRAPEFTLMFLESVQVILLVFCVLLCLSSCCIVCPVLPMTLDYPKSISLLFFLTCICNSKYVRSELLRFVNNVAIQTLMGNTLFDNIYACRIVFTCKIYENSILGAKLFVLHYHQITVIKVRNVITRTWIKNDGEM